MNEGVHPGDVDRERPVHGYAEAFDRPKVLVIAGFDQSGGAGILADIKTLEANGVYGYAVCTGMTWQNERVINRVEWYTEREIFEQIDLCLETAVFDWVKIGIGRSVQMIAAIVAYCKRFNPSVQIVLDPVIRASSGLSFWDGMDTEGLERLAADCYLLTPNMEEMQWLYPEGDATEHCRRLSASCNLYLKGGHDPLYPGRDHLWSGGMEMVLEPAIDVRSVYAKHGSGCVMSAALAANLALGHGLPEAAVRSKRYIEQFLTSNKTLLGWHRPPVIPG